MTESQATGRYALLVYIAGFICHGYRVYKYKQQHCDNSSELNKWIYISEMQGFAGN